MYKSRRFRLKPTAFVFLCQPLVSGVLIRNRDLHICFYSRTRPCLCILRETNGSPMGWQRILPRHGRIWNPPLRVRVSCLTVGTGVPDSPSQESHIHCRAGACSRRRPNFIHPPRYKNFPCTAEIFFLTSSFVPRGRTSRFRPWSQTPQSPLLPVLLRPRRGAGR